MRILSPAANEAGALPNPVSYPIRHALPKGSAHADRAQTAKTDTGGRGAKKTVNKSLKLNTRDKSILIRTPFLANLSGASLGRMLDIVTVSGFEARDILFREGEHADNFFCVLSGYVRLYRLNKDGREADIRVCGPGDTIAECLLYKGDTYRYNAQAAEPITVARFDLQQVREMAERETDVAKAVIQCLSQHLMSTMDCVANDRLQTAPQRVAHYLLDQCSTSECSASIRLPFQKSLLAGKLGLAPEALSRAFSALRRAGVTVRGRVIQINDVSALKQI